MHEWRLFVELFDSAIVCLTLYIQFLHDIFAGFELMALEEQGAAAAVPQADEFKLSHSFFRRPDKFRIGEDFLLFIKTLNLYFEAVELNDVKKETIGFTI